MARIDVGAAVGAGFGLIRRKPGTVLLWGLAHAATFAALFAVMGPIYLKMFGAMAALGPQQMASPEASQAMMSQMMGAQGSTMLVGLLTSLVGMIIYCAAFRAIIRPQDARFAYLRIGSAELFLFIIFIALEFCLAFAIVIPVLIVAMIVGVLAVMHATAVAVVVAVAAVLASAAALIWIAVRFSMVGPMMVADGQFRLFESWSLTRGHAGELFLIALSLVGILLAAEVVVGIVFLAIFMAAMFTGAGGSGGLNAMAFANPGAMLGVVAPMLVIGAVLWIPLMGCFTAIVSAPWARAYLDLTRAPVPPEGAPAV